MVTCDAGMPRRWWHCDSLCRSLRCLTVDALTVDVGAWSGTLKSEIQQRFGLPYYHRLSAWQLIGMHQIALIAFIWSEATHVSWYLCQRMRKRLASVGSFHSSAGIGGSINEEVHLKNFEAKKHAVSGCFGLQNLARDVAYWTRLQQKSGRCSVTFLHCSCASVSLRLHTPTPSFSFSHPKPYPFSLANWRGGLKTALEWQPQESSILIHATPTRSGKHEWFNFSQSF